MVNRKLIRPNLAEIKERLSSPRPGAAAPAAAPAAPQVVREGHGQSGPPQSIHKRRPIPPEQTSAEAFYYLKQMNNRTPMVVVLDNGEELRGHIEWYDRNCIKVNRDGEPNLLVFKHCIKYLFKQEEEGAGPTAVE
jgi:RNA chaperone Hfq